MKTFFDKKFLIYCLVGLTNTAITFGVTFFLLNIVHANYFVSTITGYTLGFLNSYFLNRKVTFRSSSNVSATFLKFLLVFLLAYAISNLAGLGLSRLLHFNFISYHNLAVIASGCVYLVLGFYGNKKYVFNK